MFVSDVCILLVLCFCSTLAASISSTLSALTTQHSTCPYRTINYLTHTLPQQCLPSARNDFRNTTVLDNSTGTSTKPVAPTSYGSKASTTITTHSESESDSVFDNVKPDLSIIGKPELYPLARVNSATTVSAIALTSPTPVLSLPDVIEEDSPLGSGNFLSFEDWKKQNLIKAGQSEHLGRNAGAEQREPRKRPTNMDSALDALGDDTEIDIDFSGLVPDRPDTIDGRSSQGTKRTEDTTDTGSKRTTRVRSRSKDAGTTCKERFNYASFDCAANILKTNREAKSPNAVLLENKDSYMLNQCSADNKFIILELCDDISIDTIVLANFEFFSSIFRTFRVSVSDRYPVKIDKWKTLGTFEARNTREVQAFLVENPVIWARYVRIEFLTHYGSEFYCPVSLIRVHGTTMLEEYKHDLEMSAEDEDDSDEIASSGLIEDDGSAMEVVDHFQPDQRNNYGAVNSVIVQSSELIAASQTDRSTASSVSSQSTGNAFSSPNEAFDANQSFSLANAEICHITESPLEDDVVVDIPQFPSMAQGDHWSASSEKPGAASISEISTSTTNRQTVGIASSIKEQTASRPPSSREAHSTRAESNGSEDKKSTSVGPEHGRSHRSSKEAVRSPTQRLSSSATQSQPASPTMQESFFKSVQKRLQMLETNSSLSLKYIEEQSRALRDAFQKVEQRQIVKTSSFLEHLNHTVLGELREFRKQYDQLWQSTVIELELQRERYQQESLAMHARLGILADELIFQKRVSVFQTVLIVVCLGLVLFSRGAINNYLELPLVQSVLSRSPNSRWISMSSDQHSGSPPPLARTRSALQLGSKHGILKSHQRGGSEDSGNEAMSPSEMYSPPTPVSFDENSDTEPTKSDQDPDFDPSLIERPSTSPPTLPSAGDPSTPKHMHEQNGVSIESRLIAPSASPESVFGGPLVKVEHPTPPGKHLKWRLPG